MTVLKDVPDDDLLFFISCQTVGDLSKKYNKRQIDLILHIAKQKGKIKNDNNGVSQTLISVVTDTMTYSALFLWALLGVISLSFVPLAIVVGASLLVAVGTGGLDFYASHKELKKNSDQEVAELALKFLQINCYDELIRRKKKIEVDPAMESSEDLGINSHNYLYLDQQKKYKAADIHQLVKSALIVSTTLFGTYYLAAAVVMGGFGLTAATGMMMSPVGLAIAVGVSIAVGLYFGHKCYQASRNATLLKKQDKMFDKALEKKKKKYDKLNEKTFSSKNANPHSQIIKMWGLSPGDHRPKNKINTNPQFFMSNLGRAGNKRASIQRSTLPRVARFKMGGV